MRNLALKIEQFSQTLGHTIAWLTVFMVGITFAVVVLRYVFDLGWIAMQESITYLHAMNFMLGATFTLQQNRHVRVDIFYQKFSARGQALVNLLGTLFLLMPLCGFILWVSWDYVVAAWEVKEASGEAGGLPGVYLLKLLLLLMPALLMLQGTAWIILNSQTLFSPKEQDVS